jgi:Spy/CpxP family protein refolding chaperone
MKNVRMAVMAVALVAGMAGMAAAQGGGGGRAGMGGMGAGGRGGMNMEAQKAAMFKEITLDEATSKKVDSIMTASAEAMNAATQAARQGGGGDIQAMMAQRTEMTTKRNEAIKALLNDAQKAQFDKNLAEMPTGRRGGGAGGR